MLSRSASHSFSRSMQPHVPSHRVHSMQSWHLSMLQRGPCLQRGCAQRSLSWLETGPLLRVHATGCQTMHSSVGSTCCTHALSDTCVKGRDAVQRKSAHRGSPCGAVLLADSVPRSSKALCCLLLSVSVHPGGLCSRCTAPTAQTAVEHGLLADHALKCHCAWRPRTINQESTCNQTYPALPAHQRIGQDGVRSVQGRTCACVQARDNVSRRGYNRAKECCG